MAGLADFLKEFKDTYGELYVKERFGVKDIVEWSEEHTTYSKNGVLTNSWKLGKYMKSHRGMMQKTLGVFINGSHNNKIMYSVE